MAIQEKNVFKKRMYACVCECMYAYIYIYIYVCVCVCERETLSVKSRLVSKSNYEISIKVGFQPLISL